MDVRELLETLTIAVEEGLVDEEAEIQVTYQPSYPLIARFSGIHVDYDGNLQLVAGHDIAYSNGECYEEEGLLRF
jgi:hypothetical protein